MRDSAERGAKVLQQMKVRPAIGAEGYQLSIDDRVIGKILQAARYVRLPTIGQRLLR
jgi:hypothetical protein